MKTKLTALTWRGSASVDPRFSASMLTWTIADIRNRESFGKLSIGIENGQVEAYNSDFELQFSHQLKFIVGMAKLTLRQKDKSTSNHRSATAECEIVHHQLQQPHQSNHRSLATVATAGGGGGGGGVGAATNQEQRVVNCMEIIGSKSGIIYLLKNPRDPLLHIHLYESETGDDMTELLQQMRDPTHTLGGSVGSIPQSIISGPGSLSDSSLQKTLSAQGVHSTPASNLKLSEAVRNAHHDGSPSVVSQTSRMATSKSYTSGLSHSAGTVSQASTTAGGITNLAMLSDISANHSQFFEVMYVGKIKVSHKRVPFTFIDDALPKFRAYDAQRIRLQAEAARRNSNDSDKSDVPVTSDPKPSSSSASSSSSSSSSSTVVPQSATTSTGTSQSGQAEGGNDDTAEDDPAEFREKILNTKISEENKENASPRKDKILMRGQSQAIISVRHEVPKQRDRSASIGSIPIADQNRTMVFLVGRSDLRLISPDRKQVLLSKDFKDVASCAQGQKSADHFGIICRESHTDGFIGYVFKCQSAHVADDIVAAISQAFVTSSEQKANEKMQIFSCEHCPMLWYHKLCTDVEGLNDKKQQTMIFRRMETLPEDEQNIVMAKYYGAEEFGGHSLGEQNQFLMMLLRAHCESRQQRHIHDTAENRSEFLNQYLGGSTIFMKAKRSLTSSFDHLLKRKGSKDEFALSPTSHPTDSFGAMDKGELVRSKSGTFKLQNVGGTAEPQQQPPQLKSPMMDIFIKVGNSPRENRRNSTSEAAAGSWRQTILHRVVTPSKNSAAANHSDLMSPLRRPREPTPKTPHEKRTKKELRDLWQTAIRQTILLARMEKENARLQARQSENEIKRMKLEYDEILPCDKQTADIWETFIDRDTRMVTMKRDPKVLLQAIKNGVPRSKRGEIWLFLAEQHCMHHAPVDTKAFPNYNTPYHVLLKSLTEHQHAIFIDLGRTFPNHAFYKAALGVGQLSLFNLLKAYSILDPELGYCQGLGFVCGILLLHLDEADAFELLKHLMFRRQMRTKYLPDMRQFQLQLYQLSRLIKDHIPELYDWLDQNDVSPTLYAAPWILTIFSSQFPLGFVTKVFDLLFLESSEIIFRFALALLNVHKDELLKRDNFEDIMDYLKTVVPKVDAPTIDQIMKTVFATDVSRQLSEYQVEYNVLQEEITSQNYHLETLNKAKEDYHHLEAKLNITEASIAHLEKTRLNQQTKIQSLQTHMQGMEVTVHTLGRYLAQLAETHRDIEMPGEIRRIVQQIAALDISTSSTSASQQFAKNQDRKKHTERKIGKSVSVNSHLGLQLRVLEELNEAVEKDTAGGSPAKKRTPFFESTYEQLRQQRNGMQRPNRLEDTTRMLEMKLNVQPDKVSSTIRSPVEADSGVGTPMSPAAVSVVPVAPDSLAIEPDTHPLSNCTDVSFKYNGTSQLKAIRPRSGVVPRLPVLTDTESTTEQNGDKDS